MKVQRVTSAHQSRPFRADAASGARRRAAGSGHRAAAICDTHHQKYQLGSERTGFSVSGPAAARMADRRTESRSRSTARLPRRQHPPA